MRGCATSTAGGERVGRGKAAEIASPSCVHGISEILSQILVDVRVRLMCLKLVCVEYVQPLQNGWAVLFC